jgi:hypothetical protein
MLTIGDTAADFDQPDFNHAVTGSNRFHLYDHAGKVIFLAFVAFG